MEVRALVCESHVGFAVPCYSSAIALTAEPVALVVHDDGSLSAASRDRLQSALPGSRVVSRQEADDVVEPLLRGRPALRAWRSENPLALKILDTVLMSEADTYRYVDSDVLIDRPVSGLWPAGEPTFMQDRYSAYSARLGWMVARGRRVPGRINAGIMSFPRDRYDLDAIEHFRQRFGSRVNPQWSEQTAWAWLASSMNPRVLDPARVVIASRAPDQAYVRHFVSSIRPMLLARLAADRPMAERQDETHVPIGTMPAPTSTVGERVRVVPRGAAVAARTSFRSWQAARSQPVLAGG